MEQNLIYRQAFERLQQLRERISALPGDTQIAKFLAYLGEDSLVDINTAVNIFNNPRRYDGEAAAVANMLKTEVIVRPYVIYGTFEQDILLACQCARLSVKDIDREIRRCIWSDLDDEIDIGVSEEVFLKAWLVGRAPSEVYQQYLENPDPFDQQYAMELVAKMSNMTYDQLTMAGLYQLRNDIAVSTFSRLAHCLFNWDAFKALGEKHGGK